MNNNLSEEVVFIISATSWLSREMLPFLDFSLKSSRKWKAGLRLKRQQGMITKRHPEKSGAVRPVEYHLNQ